MKDVLLIKYKATFNQPEYPYKVFCRNGTAERYEQILKYDDRNNIFLTETSNSTMFTVGFMMQWEKESTIFNTVQYDTLGQFIADNFESLL